MFFYLFSERERRNREYEELRQCTFKPDVKQRLIEFSVLFIYLINFFKDMEENSFKRKSLTEYL
jgi:hypothetical protein